MSPYRTVPLLPVLLLLALPLQALAQEIGAPFDRGLSAEIDTADAAPSTAAFLAEHDRLKQAMEVPLTGDTDVDFVRAMIVQQQGLINLAQIEIDNGADAKVRQMAKQVIKAGQEQISQMQDWLDKRDPGEISPLR